jgi:hypothetical protein
MCLSHNDRTIVCPKRTLLTGDANKNYEKLRKALVDICGRQPHQYVADLLEVKRGENETYRGLMVKSFFLFIQYFNIQ